MGKDWYQWYGEIPSGGGGGGGEGHPRMHRTVAIGPICLLSRSTPTQSSGAPTSFGAKWWKAKIGGLSGACSKQRLAAASNEMLRGANFHWFLASNYPSTLPLVPTNQPTQPNPLSPNNTRSLMLLLHTFHISPRSLCLCSYWKNQTREPNRFQSFHLLYWKGGIRAGGGFALQILSSPVEMA